MKKGFTLIELLALILILGDATGELGPFYNLDNLYFNNWWNEHSHFPNNNYPWFLRGGYPFYGYFAGQLSFSTHNGAAHNSVSFRIVITN